MSQNYENLREAIEAAARGRREGRSRQQGRHSRVRKAMQDVKNIAQEIRKEMLELRDAGGK